jgi:hypothetical protein
MPAPLILGFYQLFRDLLIFVDIAPQRDQAVGGLAVLGFCI